MLRGKILGTALAGALLVGSTVMAGSTAITDPANAVAGEPMSSVGHTMVSHTTVHHMTASPPARRPQDPPIVTPRPGMNNVRPISWQRAEPLDSRTVRVVFTSGVEPCYVLDHVTVEYGPRTVTITLYQGSDPLAENQACIMIAVQKATVVTLAEPLDGRTIVDGAPQR